MRPYVRRCDCPRPPGSQLRTTRPRSLPRERLRARPPRRSPLRPCRRDARLRARRRSARSACALRRGSRPGSQRQRSAHRVSSVDELTPGLWTWTGRHPDWNEDLHWGPDVRSYALVRDDHVLLFDPIDPPGALIEDRRSEIVLTAEWHKRSSAKLAVPVHDTGVPLPNGVEERPAFYLPEERFIWLPEQRALVAGDSLPNA